MCYEFPSGPTKLSEGLRLTCLNDMYAECQKYGYHVANLKYRWHKPGLGEITIWRKYSEMGYDGLVKIVKFFEDNRCKVVGLGFLYNPKFPLEVRIKYYFVEPEESFTNGLKMYDRLIHDGFPIRSIRVGSSPDEFRIKLGEKGRWSGFSEYTWDHFAKIFQETGYLIDQNFEDINTTGVHYRPKVEEVTHMMDALQI